MSVQMDADVMEPMGKQQLRVRETQSRLLAAAEEVFVRDGFEAAQLDEIAAKADRSKGAVYTHFKSKEDLFLALFEQRTRVYIDQLMVALQACTSRKQSMETFRGFYVGLVKDRSWPILTLEFKLFALRHPQWKERLHNAFELAKPSNQRRERRKLFGECSAEQLDEIELAIAAMGPILSGLVLESHFETKVLSEKGLERIAGKLFDALFPGGR